MLEALSQVMDPELHRSLTELNMVQDVVIEGNDVTVTVALTTKGCPLKDAIAKSVEERLHTLPGVGRVQVHLTEMSAEQRAKLLGGRLGASVLAGGSATRTLAIASGKGGVGKSTVTVNLAAALYKVGYSVAILDCDIYGFSIPRMLGVEKVRPTVLDGKIVPVPAHGMKVISMGNFVPDNAPVIWRGPMLGKALRQFLTDVLWGEPDYLLLDLPPGTGDMALDVAQLLPESHVVIVTTPQAVAAGVASRAGQMARKANQRLLGVVENMSTFVCPCCDKETAIFGEGGGADLAEELGVPLLGRIPLSLEARTSGDTGTPAALATGSVTAEAYALLARRVVDEVAAVPAAKG